MDEQQQKRKLADKAIELMMTLYLKKLDRFLANHPAVTNQEIWEFATRMVNDVPSFQQKPDVAQEFVEWLYDGTLEGLRKGDWGDVTPLLNGLDQQSHRD